MTVKPPCWLDDCIPAIVTPARHHPGLIGLAGMTGCGMTDCGAPNTTGREISVCQFLEFHCQGLGHQGLATSSVGFPGLGLECRGQGDIPVTPFPRENGAAGDDGGGIARPGQARAGKAPIFPS